MSSIQARLCFLSALMLFVGLGQAACLAAEDQPGLRIAKDASTISVFDGDRLVFRYRYADVPRKPYADMLVSPGGVQVLRDSPDDHKHHHALMFALAIDNVNFWEENSDQNGRQLHREFSDVKTTIENGVARAGFVEQLEWAAGKCDDLLLVERRAIDVIHAADLGATLVEWRCRLSPPPGKDSVEIGGNHYNGLGLRFLASMDTGGRFFNADDKEGEIVQGDQRLTPTKWCAYAAKADGRPVTVALFDAPTNFRHPATMFTMQTHFAYLSATLNAWKQPFVLSGKGESPIFVDTKIGTVPDQPLNLCYAVAVWDGEVDRATVEKLYNRWLRTDQFSR